MKNLLLSEPNDYINIYIYIFFFRLDGQSFEGLLKMFTPTVAKEILT